VTKLTPQRRFITPLPDETFGEVAVRVLPDAPASEAFDRMQSWNLHIFTRRRPPGLLLGSDVVFVEPPAG
jgi:hypothetical protein